MSMPKFYIIAEGIGFGHASRCMILAKELEKHGQVKIFTYGKAVEFVRQNGFHVHELDMDFTLKTCTKEKDLEKNIVNYISKIKLADFTKLILLMKKDTPKAIFVDSNIFGLCVAKVYGKARIFFITNGNDLAVFTNKGILWNGAAVVSKFSIQVPERVFVPDFPPPYCIGQRNLAFYGMEDKFCFVGPLAKRMDDDGWQHKLISLGGTDNESAYKLLSQIDGKFISTGHKAKNIRRIKNEQYEEYFSKAEVVITHGGHNTIQECIMAGKPMVILHDGTYMERVNNAKRVAELGLGVEVDSRFANKQVLERAIEHAIELKPNCMKFAKSAAKFHAAREIVEMTIE
ncbi:hypothetical protein HZC07_04750 [Candidatus Micrarchaeota archaeon]|nr:hypothetical protein [Candidatus Micrarchaeota archaeon]